MARIFLADGNNYVNRGWHAVAPMKNSEGFPTHGIKGTMNIIMSDIRNLEPDRYIMVFDKGGKKTWRSEVYPEYKKSPSRVEGKKNADPGLYMQYKPIRQLLKAMGIRLFGKKGVEADDLIGTLAVMFAAMGHEVLISSKDKDFASLVTKRIKMVQATSRKIIGPKDIEAMFGVKPEQMVEYLMLIGDKIDNIPGIMKCGDKTAAKWLKEFGDIKGIKANVDSMTPSIKEHFQRDKKNFKWTRRLITIKTDIKHKVTFENCAYGEPDKDRIKRLCKRYELAQLHTQIKQLLKQMKVGAEPNAWESKSKSKKK